MKDIITAFEAAGALMGLAGRIINLIDSGDAKRVEEILPLELLTAIAKENAEAKARAKFGE